MLHSFIKTTKTRCTALSVWNVVKDRLCFRFVEATTLLPESECKGTAFFVTTKLFPTFFSKKCTFSFLFTFHSVIFQIFCSISTNK